MSPLDIEKQEYGGSGLRERKKQETLQRLIETGVKLFLANGYETTTVDAIAAAAGISRRTFFYYFKSKDDILLSMQSSGFKIVCDAVAKSASDLAPLDAVQAAFVEACAPYLPDEMMILDRVMLSSESLRARKQIAYMQQEQELLASLYRRWPDPARRSSLRLVAMASMGAMRLAMEAWREDGGKRPLTALIVQTFTALRTEI